MNYIAEFEAIAEPEEVFSAIHRYKITSDPARFFPSRLVRWHFQVLSENAVGLGATYDWRISLLGIPVLAFREQIVEWQDGSCVAYRAISGWAMFFRICLEPDGASTRVHVEMDISLGNQRVDRLLRPFIEWGLEKVCRNGLDKEGIQTAENLKILLQRELKHE